MVRRRGIGLKWPEIFVLHKPNFRSKIFEKLVKIIEDAYLGKSSRRSLEQMRRREIGEPSNRLVVICF